ncbi:hypothetical protein BpHYR1_053766 [Brachionus plicatilis]|uniref:Uncharacterized protein n=1 Tax=Brachionus plicatilis TaxID=10195 RepID=A0A3M7QLE9_BRAPC|nr:hypothetical protein BpHYR1_053766 [Brachionus plicatilis]
MLFYHQSLKINFRGLPKRNVILKGHEELKDHYSSDFITVFYDKLRKIPFLKFSIFGKKRHFFKKLAVFNFTKEEYRICIENLPLLKAIKKNSTFLQKTLFIHPNFK